MQVVCIVARFVRLGAGTPVAVHHWRARQTSGTEPFEDYRRVMWVTGPRGQYSGKIRLSRNLRYQTRGRHMVKRSSDHRSGSLTRSQTSGTGPSASCGYCCHLSPHREPVPGENSFHRAPGRKWAQETCAGCSKQRNIPGEPGKLQGRDRVGIVEGFCGYRARGVSTQGKFVLSRNVGYKTRGVAMLLNVVVTPGKPNPNSNFRDGTCELWVLLPNFAPLGNFVLSSPRGEWAQEKCAGCQ